MTYWGLGIVATVLASWLMLGWLYGQTKIAALSGPPSTAFMADNERLHSGRDAVALVVIGDSRAAFWRPPPNLREGETVLRGIGGETSVQTLGRLASDALALKPRAVIIVTGINDLVAASYMTDLAAAEVVDRLVERILAAAQQVEASGSCAIIASIAPPARPSILRRLVWRKSIWTLVSLTNRTLEARSLGQWNLFPMASLLTEKHVFHLAEQWRSDTLHFNREAYALLSNYMINSLEEKKFCAVK